MMSARPAVFFISIIIVAAFVRFYRLDMLPVSMAWDEVAMFVDVKAITATGHDMHGNPVLQSMFPSWGDYKLPAYLWLASLSSWVFGTSVFSLRLPSALAGVATVAIGMLLAKRLIPGKESSRFAIWVGVVLALSPWSVVLSRSAFEAVVGQCLLAASLSLAYHWRGRLHLLPISAALGALAVYSYYSIRFVWPVVFVFEMLLFSELRRKGTVPQVINWLQNQLARIVPSIIIFFLLLMPLVKSPYYEPSQQFRLSTDSILNETALIHTANRYRELSQTSLINRLLGRAVFSQKTLRLYQFLQNVSQHLSFDFLFLYGDQNLRHGTGRDGLFLWVWIPALFAGLGFLAVRHPKTALFLLGWWLCALVPASVPMDGAHALRSLNALVPASTIVGTGLWWISRRHRLLFAAQAGLTLFGFLLFWYTYTTTYPVYSADAWSDGYDELVTAVKSAQLAHPGAAAVVVEKSDGRIPLWFLAHEIVPPADFHLQPSRDYLFTRVGNVAFDSFPSAQQIVSSKEPLLLVADPYRFDQLPKELQSHIERVETIYSQTGTVRATIAVYQP